MMRQCERLLEKCCLGKTGWRIGELMGENRAYPLWLYPRIHVHPRDPSGSLRTSSDWTISNHMVTHRRYFSPDDIASSNPYLSAPISTQRNTTSGLISIECWFIFGYVSRSLSFPFVLFSSRTAPLPLFHVFIKAVCPTCLFIP